MPLPWQKSTTPVDRVVAGMEGTHRGQQERLIAYHEVGHALIGTPIKDLQKVTCHADKHRD